MTQRSKVSKPRRKFAILRVICTGISAYVLIVGQSFAAEYTLARAPQLAATTTTDLWVPFLERLSRDVGETIKLKVYESRQRFEGDLFSGTPDFAFMNTYYAVMANARHGYISLVRDGSKNLSGLIVVRKDSPLQDVRDLNEKTIAFPDPNSMGASLYPRAILIGEMGLDFKAVYVGPHENVYRSVYLGTADAGGGVNNTFNSEPEELKSQLRILWSTPEVAPHPLIAHPRVPVDLRNRVTDAILNMVNDDEGKMLLAAVQLTSPVVVDFNRDYSHIARLGLEKYTINIDN